MIKVRLHGTPEEVKSFAEYLESLSPRVKVLQRSDSYSDRGKSSYVRVYIDVEYYDELELKLREAADKIGEHLEETRDERLSRVFERIEKESEKKG